MSDTHDILDGAYSFTWNDKPFDPRTESPWQSEDGMEKWYRPDGSLWFEVPYVNGQRHGIEKTHYEDGTLESGTLWVHGVERDRPLTKLEHLVLFGEQQ